MTSPFTDEPSEIGTPTRNCGTDNQFSTGCSTPSSTSSMAGTSGQGTFPDGCFAQSPFSPYTMDGSVESPSRGRRRRGRQSLREYSRTLSPVLEPSHGPNVDAPTGTVSSGRGSSSSHRGVSPWGQAARGSSSRAKLVHEGSRARRPNAPVLWPMAVDGGSSPELSAFDLRKERRSWSASASSSAASTMTPPAHARPPSPLLLDGSEAARHGVHTALRQLNDLAAEASRAGDIADMYSKGKQKAKARSPSNVRSPNEDKLCLVSQIDVLKGRFRARSEDGTPGRASQAPPSAYQSPAVSRRSSPYGPSPGLSRSASERQFASHEDRPSQEIRRSHSAHQPSSPPKPPQGDPEQQERQLIALQLLQLQLSQARAQHQALIDSAFQEVSQSQALIHVSHGSSQALTLLHPPHRGTQSQQQQRQRPQPQSQRQTVEHQLQLRQQGSHHQSQPEQQAF
ncbi:hypothetical protein V8C44DRAFT_129632 [Trichoderma aethiopicum]